MIVGREELVVLEKLAGKQKQMYADACDYGLLTYSSKHPEQVLTEAELDKGRKALKGLMKTFYYKTEEWATGQSVKLFIPYEEENGNYRGVSITVTYHKNYIRKIDFISIDICGDFKSKKERVFR